MEAPVKNRPKHFSERVRELPGGEHLNKCFSCGTCVSRCMVPGREEPTYNPRRLIEKTLLNMEQEVYVDKTTWLCSACDQCYPSCPQGIHISELLLALRKLAMEAGHTSPLQAASVDGQTCIACGLCSSVCPYEAIVLRQEKVLGRQKTIAVVHADRCMGCGLCGAHCRSASIGLVEASSNEQVIAELWQWLQS